MVETLPTLYHATLCPFSRTARLALGIYGIDVRLVEERIGYHSKEFSAMNPALFLPLLVSQQERLAIPGVSVITEYLEDIGPSKGTALHLMPHTPAARVEVRKTLHWFHDKFYHEAVRPILTQQVYRRFIPLQMGGGPPDTTVMRAGIARIPDHIQYIGGLIRYRKWLAGDDLSYADLAAAAHVSCLDYLGHVSWDEDEDAKIWYARVKSHIWFRPILADRVPGMPPASTYDDLDF